MSESQGEIGNAQSEVNQLAEKAIAVIEEGLGNDAARCFVMIAAWEGHTPNSTAAGSYNIETDREANQELMADLLTAATHVAGRIGVKLQINVLQERREGDEQPKNVHGR